MCIVLITSCTVQITVCIALYMLANGGGRLSPFSERRRTAFKRREEPASLTSSTSPVPPPQPTSSSNDQLNTSSLSISSIDINLDEGNEARYQMDKLNIEEFYEPISLCLISKFQIFDGLQVKLHGLCIYLVKGVQFLHDITTTKNYSDCFCKYSFGFTVSHVPTHKQVIIM